MRRPGLYIFSGITPIAAETGLSRKISAIGEEGGANYGRQTLKGSCVGRCARGNRQPKGKADKSTGNQTLPTSGTGNQGELLQFSQERIESVNNTLVKLALVEQLADPRSSGFCLLAQQGQ